MNEIRVETPRVGWKLLRQAGNLPNMKCSCLPDKTKDQAERNQTLSLHAVGNDTGTFAVMSDDRTKK